MRIVAVAVLTAVAAVTLAAGKEGGAPGKAPPAVVERPVLPAEPALSPDQALGRFKVAAGYRIELVASEPLVRAPVAATFDGDGRLWVVEMPGFMPDAEGSGEDAPNGAVVVLEDGDGDGRMDRRTEYLGGLVIPRSVLPLADGGALIAAPPFLYHCRDRNRDLRCDEKTVVADNYGTAENPEHDANGLVPALDNWIYSANTTARFRLKNGRWERGTTINRGQWGISQDDVGRLVFNTNSEHLRGDLLPIFAPEAHTRRATGFNVRLSKREAVYPGRTNYGVNRGYQSGLLRDDGTLSVFTAACGPVVYRGDGFPQDARGNLFVAEPAGNLVRRSVVSEENGKLVAQNAYDKAEFLTSTDERFRPVNLTNGPDGALYVVDMYRGLIQHRIYLTPYLKQQVRARGLETPIDRGRIWRVVHEGTRAQPGPRRLTRASNAVLVNLLGHPNGWWRDVAQRTLVQRGDRRVAAAVERLLTAHQDARVRLHALFTLDGLGRVNERVFRRAAADQDRFVRLAGESLRAAAQRAGLDAVAEALSRDVRSAARTRARGQELELLERLLVLPAWAAPSEDREKLLGSLASRVSAEGGPARVLRLLELVALEDPATRWRQRALLAGAAEGLASRPEPVALPTPPARWARIANAEDPDLQETSRALMRRLSWPKMHGDKDQHARGPKLTMTSQQRASFERGRQQYKGICGACHQPSGLGEDGKGPPLVDSEWVLGSPERLVRITLQGLRGPVKVGNVVYEMEMPSMGALGDEQIADLLTYIRMEPEWGHEATPVDPAMVARIRKATEARQDAWTAAELAGLR
jgi:mono/diheme cytochrome c family protein/glucose/arabinose dehydrogenase